MTATSTWTPEQGAAFVALWALSPKNRDMPGLVFALTRTAGERTVQGLIEDAWCEVITYGCLGDLHRLDQAAELLLRRFR